LGSDHPDVTTSLNNLASLYYSQGRYSEAEPLYLRSLEIKDKVLGENHPSTKRGWENFRLFVQQMVEEGREGELSDHPMTQAVLQEILKSHD
jgi:tetratricopeptide (TPR) repeat protein